MTLPNFLIIGAAKAATTSLYHYLGQHPDVYMSPVKEPAYYTCDRPELAAPVIRERAAYERLFDGVTSQRAVGEASPQYLNDPTAPERIAADLPGVRLIVSLRNPADRAYSSYLGRLSAGTERRSVDEALREETYYFTSSLYHAPLSRYFERFDRDRIRVILFDDVAASPHAVVSELCDFLQIDRSFELDVTERHGVAAAPRSRTANALFWRTVETVRRALPLKDTGMAARAGRLFLRRPEPLPAPIRRRLLDGFSEDIRETESLIGRSLSHWLA